MKNWWYYHKWYVICGIILLFSIINLIGSKLGWFKDAPDIQIAYIGDSPLSEEKAASLEEAFSSLADDYNHDGRIFVQINQFVSNASMGDIESLSYQQAAEIALIGDIDDCTSYFFLMEDPDKVQREFQVLAMPDGSCPPEYDLSAGGKIIPWDSQLYLGRRCFYNEKRTPYADECSKIWNTLQTQYDHTGGIDKNAEW